MLVILLPALALLFCIGIPVAFALGGASWLAMMSTDAIPLTVLPQKWLSTISMNALAAIPFFILAGSIMSYGGISRRIISFTMSFLSKKTGGLSIATILAVMIFAAISGSSAATAAAIGMIMIPEMVKYGYDKRYAAAVVSSSAELGVIIPPSSGMIIYGVVTGASVGTLFIAGVIPGIMIGMSLIILTYIRSKRRGYNVGVPSDVVIPGKWESFKSAFWSLLMPFIILGGIYGGIFSPTEAAVVAAWYGVIVGVFIHRELKPKDFIPILKNTLVSTAMVMMIVANASLFAWLLTRERVPYTIAAWFGESVHSKIMFLIIINLLLFLVGMFFEAGPAIIILAPILLPIAQGFGISEIQFGIIMMTNLAVGMCTPPVGLNLYISCGIAKISIEELTKWIWPCLLVLVIDVLVISYVPAISMFLPSFMR